MIPDPDPCLCLHFSRDNILIICVILHKYRWTFLLQSLRVDDEIHKERCRLGLAHIGANPVVTAWCLIPGAALLDYPHRIIIHLIQDRATNHVGGDRGAPVTVRGCRTVRRIFDEHSDNGLSRAVDELILVSDGGRRQRTPSANLDYELHQVLRVL